MYAHAAIQYSLLKLLSVLYELYMFTLFFVVSAEPPSNLYYQGSTHAHSGPSAARLNTHQLANQTYGYPGQARQYMNPSQYYADCSWPLTSSGYSPYHHTGYARFHHGHSIASESV